MRQSRAQRLPVVPMVGSRVVAGSVDVPKDLACHRSRIWNAFSKISIVVRTLPEGYGSLSGGVDSLSNDVRGVMHTLDTLVARLEAKNVI